MKKLITLIIVASLALTIQAQDVTNTLGTDGDFFVNKLGGSPSFLTLSSTNDHTIQFSTTTSGLIFKNSIGESIFSFDETFDNAALTMLTVGHADANWISGGFAHLQLQGENSAVNNKFNMIARGAVNYFNAYSASNTGASPTNSVNNQIILRLNAYGYQNGDNRLAAGISFVVDGTPATDYVPGRITFQTGTNAGISAIRMTIDNAGTVNIADLAGSYTNGEAYVIVNDAGDLIAQDAAPSKSINNQIQHLEEENVALKAEMAELRKMIEMLMNEK